MNARQTPPKPPAPRRAPVGIQSVEIALAVLQAMVRQGGAASLGDLSRATRLQPSKLHRYLVSLVRCGMAVRLPGGGHYDLGPEARRLGAAAFSRFDGVSLAQDCVTNLAGETGQTVLLYVWTEQGATLIRQQSGIIPLSMSLRIGSTVPLRRSAIGQVFLAFMPPAATVGLVAVQAGEGDPWTSDEALDQTLDRIRAEGVFWTTNTVLPGAELLAVPVFEGQHRLHSVIALPLPQRSVTAELRELLTGRVRAAAEALSRELGDHGPAP